MDMNGPGKAPLSSATHNVEDIYRDFSISSYEEIIPNQRTFYPTNYVQDSVVLPSRRPTAYQSIVPDSYSTRYSLQLSAPAKPLNAIRQVSGQWNPFIRVPIAIIIFLCKRVILLDPVIKVCIYLGCVLFIPILGDYMPSYTRPYFAQRDNVFNIYFVKIGWFLTLLLSLPFVSLTSYTLCCGDIKKMLLHHLPRLAIGTFFWFTWTSIFNLIAKFYGSCSNEEYGSRLNCQKAGHNWYTFDISGHTFILMHSSLVFIEETRPLLHWSCIDDFLNSDLKEANNPLSSLTEEELTLLRISYPIVTPILHTLFVIIAGLQLLWDVMLLGTMLYHHTKTEKIISCITAVTTWYFTYRFWYDKPGILPEAASTGCFCYNKGKERQRPITQKFDNVAEAATNVATVFTEGVRGSIQLTSDFLAMLDSRHDLVAEMKEPKAPVRRRSWAQAFVDQSADMNKTEDLNKSAKINISLPKPKTKISERFRRRISRGSSDRSATNFEQNDQQQVSEKTNARDETATVKKRNLKKKKNKNINSKKDK